MIDPADVNGARTVTDPMLAVSRCRHGTMMYLRQDIYIGRSFAEYGEYSEGEVELFARSPLLHERISSASPVRG